MTGSAAGEPPAAAHESLLPLAGEAALWPAGMAQDPAIMTEFVADAGRRPWHAIHRSALERAIGTNPGLADRSCGRDPGQGVEAWCSKTGSRWPGPGRPVNMSAPRPALTSSGRSLLRDERRFRRRAWTVLAPDRLQRGGRGADGTGRPVTLRRGGPPAAAAVPDSCG